jgi:hypothetical protein
LGDVRLFRRFAEVEGLGEDHAITDGLEFHGDRIILS